MSKHYALVPTRVKNRTSGQMSLITVARNFFVTLPSPVVLENRGFEATMVDELSKAACVYRDF